jgi:hypothetical protein
MRSLKQIAAIALVIYVAANAGAAGTDAFQTQMIVLPVNGAPSRFFDLDNDRRSELLAVDPVGKRLLLYRQRAPGFTNAPDQVIGLPPQTAWISPCDVDAHPGVELLMSTVTGVVYHRQNSGVFESERRTLIKADQVFTNDDSPILVSLVTNTAIPVISATQAVLYQRNNAFEWSHGQPTALEVKPARWTAKINQWTTERNPSRSLRIRQSVWSKPNDADDDQPDKDAIGKVLEEMKKNGSRSYTGTNRVDLNGDGQTDLVLWQRIIGMEPKTDVYVLLRGGDGRLPARPTQVLHCSGLPIPIGSTQEHSPLGDLKSDGTYQLALLKLESTVTSVSSALEMALTRGREWALTIRRFNHGAFSRNPDTALVTTVGMSAELGDEWPLFICGDYNGDGRPDFAVRRATSQWNVFVSTDDERWFAPQPAMIFETPMQGYFEINDLNGDGRSDLVLRSNDDPRIFIFLSQSTQSKGQRP